MMWLAAVESGHDKPTRTFLNLSRRLTGADVPAIVKVCCYRHRFFGTPFNALVMDVMRGKSFWTVGERELFAADISRQNECPFCATAHRAVAGAFTDQAVVDATLESLSTADVRAEVKAMLRFLRKMSHDPDALAADDASALRVAGIPDVAIDQAVRIGTLFELINRVMNAVGAGPLEGRSLRVGVLTLKLVGYRNPPPVRLLSRGR